MNDPQLLDQILDNEFYKSARVQINGKWYCAKGVSFDDWRICLVRAKHAWLVLVGKARAYQFAEDRWPK